VRREKRESTCTVVCTFRVTINTLSLSSETKPRTH
jgi:hypothetical protein